MIYIIIIYFSIITHVFDPQYNMFHVCNSRILSLCNNRSHDSLLLNSNDRKHNFSNLYPTFPQFYHLLQNIKERVFQGNIFSYLSHFIKSFIKWKIMGSQVLLFYKFISRLLLLSCRNHISHLQMYSIFRFYLTCYNVCGRNNNVNHLLC